MYTSIGKAREKPSSTNNEAEKEPEKKRRLAENATPCLSDIKMSTVGFD